MLPLSSESISQIKVLQHTNADYLFNVQRIVTQNGDFCDQCVHELFCYFWAGEFTPKRAPTFFLNTLYVTVCKTHAADP
jgi:hypothetical protein